LFIYPAFFWLRIESFRHLLKATFISRTSSSGSSGKSFSGKVRLKSYFCDRTTKYFNASEIKPLIVFGLLLLQRFFGRDCWAGMENVPIGRNIFQKIIEKAVARGINRGGCTVESWVIFVVHAKKYY
jgi:hypothetical protein